MQSAFLSQVPNWVPMNADAVVILLGVIEMFLDTGVLFLLK
ncbi:hypothetical protein IWX84_002821 [Flavobacterium sp. CG_9.10]|nr:hypothetical protein [Flavobacterium sp. CG_9.10]MBG6111930.1 hypothetical protein [Flavobacterium sp. CG_9.10]